MKYIASKSGTPLKWFKISLKISISLLKKLFLGIQVKKNCDFQTEDDDLPPQPNKGYLKTAS